MPIEFYSGAGGPPTEVICLAYRQPVRRDCVGAWAYATPVALFLRIVNVLYIVVLLLQAQTSGPLLTTSHRGGCKDGA